MGVHWLRLPESHRTAYMGHPVHNCPNFFSQLGPILRDGKRHIERAAPSHLALKPDLPAVQFNQRACHIQPQPGAPVPLVRAPSVRKKRLNNLV